MSHHPLDTRPQPMKAQRTMLRRRQSQSTRRRSRSRHLVVESFEARRLLAFDLAGSEFRLFVDSELSVPGLVGSYVDQSLRSYSPHDDWRISQSISGTRVDPRIDFVDASWGQRAEVGLTRGTDENWDFFSVQWDGFVQVVSGPVGLATRSDDGSRMWIDINGDGVFETSGPEFVDNNWGSGQAVTTGPASPLLARGVYRIRLQYEESAGGNIMQLVAVGAPTVRAAYIIPSNREPQPNGLDNLRDSLRLYQDWYSDQMDRNGFGNLTFRLETEGDGLTPKVHLVQVPETDDYLRVDAWDRVGWAASAARVPLWSAGQIWLLVPEIHLQNPDGSIIGNVGLGAGFGSGQDSGIAMIGSGGLAFANSASLSDDTAYHGQIVPEIGPYPLVQDVSYPWFEGSTFSSLSSTYLGATLHELTHAFGMPHDFRNDGNFNGNLMGNGLRGFRGVVYPEHYAPDNCFLSYGLALAISTNRYFQEESAPETQRPEVTVTTAGPTALANGLLPIAFTATDDTGLAAALLVRNGDLIDEVALSGVWATHTFATPYFTPGTSETYAVIVYDVHGNRQIRETTVTPPSGSNRAPQPFINISSPTVRVGQTVDLDSFRTTDPDHPTSSLLVEWDLDGDGIYDTAPTTDKSLAVTFPEPGPILIRARLTDPLGAASQSAALTVRVVAADATDVHQNPVDGLDVNADGWITPLDALVVINHMNAEGMTPVSKLGPAPPYLDVNGDGHITPVDVLLVINRLNEREHHPAGDFQRLEVAPEGERDRVDGEFVFDYSSVGSERSRSSEDNDEGRVARLDSPTAANDPTKQPTRDVPADDLEHDVALKQWLETDENAALEPLFGELLHVLALAG